MNRVSPWDDFLNNLDSLKSLGNSLSFKDINDELNAKTPAIPNKIPCINCPNSYVLFKPNGIELCFGRQSRRFFDLAVDEMTAIYQSASRRDGGACFDRIGKWRSRLEFEFIMDPITTMFTVVITDLITNSDNNMIIVPLGQFLGSLGTFAHEPVCVTKRKTL